MSQYNHVHDRTDHKEKCVKCGKSFRWSETGKMYPGGKVTECINCP